MVSKVFRLTKALRNETAKRIPIIIIIFLSLLLWQNYTNGQKANQTLNKIASLGQQLKDLAEDNKKLSQQNKDLSTQLNDKTDNINKHVDCVVTLFLPNKPLPGASDIDDCRATFSTNTSASAPASPQKSSSVPSSQPTPTPTPAKQDNPQPTQPTRVKKICSTLPIVKNVCK